MHPGSLVNSHKRSKAADHPLKCDPQDGHFEKSAPLAGHLCFNRTREIERVIESWVKREALQKFSVRKILINLKRNPNVQHVSETKITYSPTFKVAAVQAYFTGQPPMEILLEAGFHIDTDKPKKYLLRWIQVFTDL
jgi:hypothetical protein